MPGLTRDEMVAVMADLTAAAEEDQDAALQDLPRGQGSVMLFVRIAALAKSLAAVPSDATSLLELGFVIGALPGSSPIPPLRLMWLAKRKRFAQIQHAVTKGLSEHSGPHTTKL